jgi:hypothetical protein
MKNDKVKHIVRQVISDCGECPFVEWESDNSESNHSGCSRCKKADREIAWDDKHPRIPKWCPLPNQKNTRQAKRRADTPCLAEIWHGPGHQSRTRCHLRGPHDIHCAVYGCYDQVARWRGKQVFSGYFDEPPEEPRASRKGQPRLAKGDK